MPDTLNRDFRPIPLPDYEALPEATMRRRARAFLRTMRRRHTVRDFSPRPVPRDIIEDCIRTAGTAPNGANLQPWHFAVIGDPKLKRRVRHAAEEAEAAFYAGGGGRAWLEALKPLGTDPRKPFLETAPWLICLFGARNSPDSSGAMRKNYYVPESVSIAAGLLIAALHQSGLATLTHTPNPMGFLNDVCRRPRNEKPYILLVTGYPAENATIPASARKKKSLDEIASFL